MLEQAFWSATQLAEAIQAGEVSSVEAVKNCIQRIEKFDGALNAVCVQLFEEALQRAQAADDARSRSEVWGPLHGVPMTVKEAYDIAGTPTTWGLSERAHHKALFDSEVVRRLRNAGALIIGKTNVPPNLADWQADNPVYGRTNNPWDLDRTPGGSSGGSAVALAVGFSYLEAGSDIGGSLRIPAHYCGICAHKPSFGTVPDTGHRLGDPEESIDLIVCGPMARYVEDLELGLHVMGGPEPRDAPGWSLALPPARHQRLKDFRIAVIVEEPVCRISLAVRNAIENVADVCARAGATVDRDATMPHDSRSAHYTFLRMLRAAFSSSLSDDQFDAELRIARSRDAEDESYRALIARGFVQSHRDWLAADAERLAIRRAWSAFFKHYDVLLCPNAPTAAWPHDTRDRYERVIDVDGTNIDHFDQLLWAGVPVLPYLPATTIPAGLSTDGLPVGVQIISEYLEDRTALAAARLIETEIGSFTPPPGYTGAD